jgi:ABC-type amino acid transport substrate-binding protein
LKFTKILVLLFSLAAAAAVSVQAQDSQRDQAIDRLAEMSASQISTTHPKRVLVSPLQNCLRESSICSQLETALHTALATIGASPQFLSRDEVNRVLAKRRLMEIDAYDGAVLRWIASDLRADLLITEDLLWNPAINGVSTEFIDVAKDQSLGGYRVPIVSVSASDEPVLVKDEKSGVSLIIFYSATSSIKVPTCSSCPAPSFTAQSDALLRERFRGVVPLRVTVTPEGVAKQITPIGALNPLLAQKAIDTVSEWHFHPAIGADGKPFPARSSVEVTFRLE